MRAERARLPDVGLRLDDVKPLLSTLQKVIVVEQPQGHCGEARRCSTCAVHRHVKDYCTRRLDMVVGVVVVRAPRFRSVPVPGAQARLTLSGLLPDRATLELRRLQASLPVEMSYRRAAALLNRLLPRTPGYNAVTGQRRIDQVSELNGCKMRGRGLTVRRVRGSTPAPLAEPRQPAAQFVRARGSRAICFAQRSGANLIIHKTRE